MQKVKVRIHDRVLSMCSANTLTNPYAVEVIRTKRRELVGGISNTEDLLDLLTASGVLLPESRLLVSRIPGREERNARMLNLLVSRGERACRIFFYPCLKQAEPDLYRAMRSYVGGANESIHDARRQLIGYLLERDRQGPTKDEARGAPLKKTPHKAEQDGAKQKVRKDEAVSHSGAKAKEAAARHKPGLLFSAAAAGDLPRLEELLNGADVNATRSPSGSLLHAAAERGQLSVIEFLLGRGAALDARDGQGRTALHRAAERGHTAAVRALARAGADLHARDRASEMPLHRAARDGHRSTVAALVEEERRSGEGRATFLHVVAAAEEDDWELAELLLRSGATSDGKDGHGKTPLFHAVTRGNERTAAALLRAGARVDSGVVDAAFKLNEASMFALLLRNVKATMMSPAAVLSALFKAVRRNLEGIAVAIVDSGADVNACNELGYTPLLLAAELGHAETFRALVTRQARLDERLPNLTSALHLAVQSGSVSIAQVLLEKGLDPNSAGPRDQTPLHLTALHNQPALVQLLLASGALVNAPMQDGLTALHLASQSGHAEVATHLVEGKADLHARDRTSRTALHWAAGQGHAGTVRVLLSAGADGNASEKEKKTPLHLAAAEGRSEAVSSLLMGKARVGAKDMDGCTALHYATANGHVRVVTALLSTGKKKNVDDRNVWRRTPLHTASEHGHDDLVNLLLGSGAKINALDNSKDTPLHCASRAGHLGAAQRLVNWAQGERTNLNATNNVQKTALQVAEAGDTPSHQGIATLLKRKMFLIK